MAKVLNDTNRREINAALAELNNAIPLVDLLEKIGYDTAGMRQDIADLKARLQTIKEDQFPGQP